MEQEVYHIPALLPESLEALDINPGGIYIDATLGGGGHSRAIVERLGAEGHLYSLDQDMDAISRTFTDQRFTAVHGNFRYLENYCDYLGISGRIDGILADLGVSSHHFDDASRGFSFRADGPLDMRMNRSAGRPASALLCESDEEKLADLFKIYGELPQARRLARAIAKARAAGEDFATVSALLTVVKPFIDPRKEKKELAQVFQALRIEVNDEMGALKELLTGALRVLRPGGRLAVITYHSLEDRMVKNFFKTGDFAGKVDKDFYGRVNAPLKPLGNRPVTPSDEEIDRNPRSRSAKLRVAVKL